MHTQLLPLQKLLDQNGRPGLPKNSVRHHFMDCRTGLLMTLGNHDPFSGGQSVRLHHLGTRKRGTKPHRLILFRKRAGSRRRNFFRNQQLLAKGLAPLQTSPVRSRSKYPDSQSPQPVRQSRTERCFRPHHHQTGALFLRPSCDSHHIRGRKGEVDPQLGRAGVAWGEPDFLNSCIPGKGPPHGMLPSPSPHDQN